MSKSLLAKLHYLFEHHKTDSDAKIEKEVLSQALEGLEIDAEVDIKGIKERIDAHKDSHLSFTDAKRIIGDDAPTDAPHTLAHTHNVDTHAIPSAHKRVATVITQEDMATPVPEPHPTWLNPIKDFFTSKDRNCMVKHKGFDLYIYDDVKKYSRDIHGQVSGGWMPPPEDNKPWSQEKVLTFRNWIVTGEQYGTTTPSLKSAVAYVPDRLRKSLTELTDAEVKNLGAAFKELMERDPTDPKSYFAIASFHGLPGLQYCWHHFWGFLPWHRYYNLLMEDALRSTKAAQEHDITLPYWDISSDKVLPKWTYEAPFDSYVYQMDVGEGTHMRKKGTKTIRETWEFVTSKENVKTAHDTVSKAMLGSSWEAFADYQRFGDNVERVAVERAHDYIHNLCGGGVRKADPPLNGDELFPEYTAFDPIFWFQHAEFDRLCWEWQKQRHATTVEGHMKTYEDPSLADFYLRDPFNPWDDHCFEKILNFAEAHFNGTIVSVDYTPGSFHQLPLRIDPHEQVSVHPVPWALKAKVNAANKVVWLTKFDRTKISGSFKVELYAEIGHEKKLIDTEYVFQPLQPAMCDGCKEKPKFKFGFPLKQNLSDDTVYSFVITSAITGKMIDVATCGKPKLKISLAVIKAH